MSDRTPEQVVSEALYGEGSWEGGPEVRGYLVTKEVEAITAALRAEGMLVGVVVGMVIEAERHRDWYGNVRGDGE